MEVNCSAHPFGSFVSDEDNEMFEDPPESQMRRGNVGGVECLCVSGQ
jgi:hypothetical protein